MNKATFKFAFEGSAVESGEIDIQDLASSLMAVAGLIQVVNEEVNGKDAKVSVKLQATSKGSVVVDLVIVQSIIEQAASLLDSLSGHKDGISAAKDLVELIFQVGGVGAVATGGYFTLMKWLAGRKPDQVEEKGSQSHIHIGDIYFVADSRVVGLTNSLPVLEQANKVISALNREGIDRLYAQVEGGVPLKIKKDDISSFSMPVSEIKEQVLIDRAIEMYLQIDSLSFKEGNKWRVTEGGDPFYVYLEDAQYLKMIHDGQVSFSINDILHCRVNERQVMMGKVHLKKEYRILEVLGHRRGSTQLHLL